MKKHPKPIMKLSELIEMGYPKEWLLSIYRNRHQDVAWKMDESKSNSPILFDTEELERFRKSQCTGV